MSDFFCKIHSYCGLLFLIIHSHCWVAFHSTQDKLLCWFSDFHYCDWSSGEYLGALLLEIYGTIPRSWIAEWHGRCMFKFTRNPRTSSEWLHQGEFLWCNLNTASLSLDAFYIFKFIYCGACAAAYIFSGHFHNE